MGTFFRAAIGFAVALTLLHGQEIWRGVKTPSVLKVESDIAAAHRGARMQASFARLLASQNGTTPQK